MPVSVRAAMASDAATLADFNVRLAAESEDTRLDPAVVTRGVSAMFADPSKGRYYLAVDCDVPVGQLGITFEWSDWRCGWLWWIQSVYTVPAARGQGVYGALFRHVVAEARQAGDVVGVRLYVKQHNERGKRAYLAAGMVPAGYEVFEYDLKSESSSKPAKAVSPTVA